MRGTPARTRRHPARDERGTVAILVAVTMGAVLMVSAAFTVDLGLQRVARSDAQALADVVALDLVRHIDGVATVGDLTAGDRDDTWARESRDRNLDVLGTGQGRAPRLDVEWGYTEDGVFRAYDQSADSTKIPTAVRVRAHTRTGFVFSGATGRSEGDAHREAVASADRGACFRLGSFLARLRSGNSTLLNPILNTVLNPLLSSVFGSSGTPDALNLDLVGYQGLADAEVSLADLVRTGKLGVGSVSELLRAEDVSIADLVAASADVLSAQAGGGSTAAVTALNLIKAAIKAGAPTIKIGDLLSASPTDPAALGTSLNVFDMITAAALVANGTNAIALDKLDVNLGLISAKTTLKVIQAPRKTCSTGHDDQVARTAQVELVTKVTSNAINQAVAVGGLVNARLKVDPINLTITTKLAHAEAKLTGVEGCTGTGAQQASFQVSSAAVPAPTVQGSIHATIEAGLDVGASTPLLGDLLGVLGGLLSPLKTLGILDIGSTQLLNASLKIDLTAGVQTAAAAGITPSTPVITVPASHWADPEQLVPYEVPGTLIPKVGTLVLQPTAVTIGGQKETSQVLLGLLGIPILGTKQVSAINQVLGVATGPLVNAVTGSVLNLVNGLTSTLQETVVKQVSTLLGLNLGGADLWVDHEPKCGIPRLVQ
ncbi:hypothetical protein [Nocardioides sp. BYT-33-1]|uniref:hypothetical protein n=1 Tax=Nocardioides sp. BYT-33-1 TaxID=3416952 RepID=UPI003F52D0CD